MNPQESTAKHGPPGPKAVPSLERSLLIGGLGFALVSLCVFATVAFAERWMYQNLGLTGAYIAWTALFILLGGGVLGSLVVGRWRLPKFYLLFGLAFFMYAVGWEAYPSEAAAFIKDNVTKPVVGYVAGCAVRAGTDWNDPIPGVCPRRRVSTARS